MKTTDDLLYEALDMLHPLLLAYGLFAAGVVVVTMLSMLVAMLGIKLQIWRTKR